MRHTIKQLHCASLTNVIAAFDAEYNIAVSTESSVTDNCREVQQAIADMRTIRDVVRYRHNRANALNFRNRADRALIVMASRIELAETILAGRLRAVSPAGNGCQCVGTSACTHGAKCQGSADVVTTGNRADGNASWVCMHCAHNIDAKLVKCDCCGNMVPRSHRCGYNNAI